MHKECYARATAATTMAKTKQKCNENWETAPCLLRCCRNAVPQCVCVCVCVAVLCCQLTLLYAVSVVVVLALLVVIQSISAFVCQVKLPVAALFWLLLCATLRCLCRHFALFLLLLLVVIVFLLLAAVFLWSGSNSSAASATVQTWRIRNMLPSPATTIYWLPQVVAAVVVVVAGLSVGVMLLSTHFLIKFSLSWWCVISIIICVCVYQGTKHANACERRSMRRGGTICQLWHWLCAISFCFMCVPD